MNAAAKALADTNWVEGNIFSMSLLKKRMITIILIIAVLLSALAIVYVKTFNRRMFSQLQAQYDMRDKLQVEWGQLLLEQSTWATSSRIQHIAQNNLHMLMPEARSIVLVKE